MMVRTVLPGLDSMGALPYQERGRAMPAGVTVP